MLHVSCCTFALLLKSSSGVEYSRTPELMHHPHKINDEHRQCKPRCGVYFALFLASDNSYTTRRKIPPVKGQGRKDNINKSFLGPNFLRTFLTLTPGCPGVNPHHWGRRKTHFLVQTSTIFGADVHDPKGSRKTLSRKSSR